MPVKKVVVEETPAEPVILEDESLRIPVYLPPREDDGTGKTDQTESVTITGGKDIECKIKLGETVNVTLPVWKALYEKYPEIARR